MTSIVKKTVNNFLQPIGVYVAKTAPSSKVQQIVELLKPIDCGIELIRVGGDNDGGYLLPNDMDGIKYCFSPGVADTATFELECLARGISSFLADYSVDAPPIELRGCKFSKKFIGAVNNEEYMTLDQWVSESLTNERDRELILQMDIEGAEYRALLGAERSIRKHKPRLAICLYHNVEDFIQIPELLLSMVPEYNLSLRHHSKGCTDTILYAVP